MIAKFAQREWPSLFALLVMLLASLWAWPRLPVTVPVHWNLLGEPDRFAGRLEGLLTLPLVALFVYLLLLNLSRIDPRAQDNAALVKAVREVTLPALGVLHLGLIALYLGVPLDIPRLVSLVVGVLFLVTGNLLPKAKPNLVVGIRTPWTLTSKRSWYLSQRLGGWVLVGCGLAFIAAGLLLPGAYAGALILGLTFLSLTGVVLFSYLVWRRDDTRRAL